MIVTAVIVSWLFDKPIPMKPLMVSKLNTVAQVAFAALVLASLGFNFKPAPYDVILMGFVTVFTLVSVSLYLVEWVRHMSTIDALRWIVYLPVVSRPGDLRGSPRSTSSACLCAAACGEPDPRQFPRRAGQ